MPDLQQTSQKRRIIVIARIDTFLAAVWTRSVADFCHAHRTTWATVCKMVRPVLSDCCLSCLSVCDVDILRPNGWMDQDATRHGGRPRPRPHCVRWSFIC